MSVSDLSDESLKGFYESVRKEVEADLESVQRGDPHFFRPWRRDQKYEASLSEEIDRRRLSYVRIVWL